MFNLHYLKFIRLLLCDSLSSGKSEPELTGKAEISENSQIIYASGGKKSSHLSTQNATSYVSCKAGVLMKCGRFRVQN